MRVLYLAILAAVTTLQGVASTAHAQNIALAPTDHLPAAAIEATFALDVARLTRTGTEPWAIGSVGWNLRYWLDEGVWIGLGTPGGPIFLQQGSGYSDTGFAGIRLSSAGSVPIGRMSIGFFLRLLLLPAVAPPTPDFLQNESHFGVMGSWTISDRSQLFTTLSGALLLDRLSLSCFRRSEHLSARIGVRYASRWGIVAPQIAVHRLSGSHGPRPEHGIAITARYGRPLGAGFSGLLTLGYNYREMRDPSVGYVGHGAHGTLGLTYTIGGGTQLGGNPTPAPDVQLPASAGPSLKCN